MNSILSTGLSDEERKSGVAGSGRGIRGPPEVPMAEVLTVTVKDACRISGLGASTVWKLIAEKKLETVKVYNRTLVIVSSLRALLAPAS